MKKFSYKVLTEQNILQKGILEAESLEEARRTIRSNDWKMIRVKEHWDLKASWKSVAATPLTSAQLSAFCYNMAVMVETGISLVGGMQTLILQTKNTKMKQMLQQLLSELERGSMLSDAMHRNETFFPPQLIPMIASGELSGNLDEVFYNMAEYYERENVVREKIKSASMYPAILAFIGFILVIFFINFILPSLTDLISQTGSNAKLPALTQAVINIAYLIRDEFLLIVLIGGILIGAFLYYSRKEPLKTWKDRLILKLPLFGAHTQKVITARFTGTFALYLKTGLPISTSLRSLEDIVSNEVVKRVMRDASERVIRGESLTDSLREGGFFDGLVIEMMRVGEDAGNLEEMLQKLSKQYDKKVIQSIDKMVALIEPVFTLVIGGAVAILVIAMALPMLNLSNFVSPG